MSELEFLRKWIELVQKMNQWPHYSDWTNHQFQTLSDEISEKSKIKIDRNTIRKIVESVNDGKPYSPHISTKDALAKYVGRKNWLTLKKSLQEPLNKLDRIFWLLIAILVIISASVVYYFINDNFKNSNFEFSVENPEGIIPHTVVCNYNFKDLKTNNISIDYGHVNPDGNYTLVNVNKNSFINKVCFHFPGDYNIRLFIDNEVVAEQKVWVNSEDWFIYAIDAASYISKNKLPEVVEKAGVQFLQNIPFNAILQPQITRDGYFHIPEKTIMAIEGQTPNYHLHLKNFKHFSTDLRNSTFSLRFKDPNFGSGFNCSEFAVYLHGEKEQVGFKFAQKGCERYTHQRIGKTFTAGNEADLDYLILDYKQFRTLSIKGTPDQIILLLDGHELKAFDNDEEMGEVRGIHVWFKGSPYIDFIRLANEDGDIVFNEEFDGK